MANEKEQESSRILVALLFFFSLVEITYSYSSGARGPATVRGPKISLSLSRNRAAAALLRDRSFNSAVTALQRDRHASINDCIQQLVTEQQYLHKDKQQYLHKDTTSARS